MVKTTKRNAVKSTKSIEKYEILYDKQGKEIGQFNKKTTEYIIPIKIRSSKRICLLRYDYKEQCVRWDKGRCIQTIPIPVPVYGPCPN